MIDVNTFLFYLFSSIAIVSGLTVISARNPVHSVLFLILVFCNAAGLLIMLEVEFLAMMFLIVYVGAIAVLFLFVVMMLARPSRETVEPKPGLVLRTGPRTWAQNLAATTGAAALIALTFLMEVFLIVDQDLVMKWDSVSLHGIEHHQNWFEKVDQISNIEVLGTYIYTDFFYFFLMAGLILLVAMIGAIVLTLNRSTIGTRKQEIFNQVSRKFSSVECVSMRTSKA